MPNSVLASSQKQLGPVYKDPPPKINPSGVAVHPLRASSSTQGIQLCRLCDPESQANRSGSGSGAACNCNRGIDSRRSSGTTGCEVTQQALGRQTEQSIATRSNACVSHIIFTSLVLVVVFLGYVFYEMFKKYFQVKPIY
ncbi:hypothetical protein PGTUg99_026209 [Puccinia graminis f. sp. tritici]|uniref:Uncharacterized protein n=1 Tax=Puccinia graminis f. sp. tritici TaxID=56615 RepID=A0A5B0PPN5_PUCGR|nr:hypothetical protein PGTUg99_026209 [Puccinia graminis f. sp. tritici]